ncbi:MAG: biotin--[acetyl-CoA-carboxylase] ligase [Chlorobi bacterium]|nr:biotin--[acetyl-CoA-carboxylase] ligase [Chlorobiota bacterium]MCI0717062.1 biotin--[acetyl-CoA-carboxylase] ligase [Chlorobiota bacterium]
MLNIDLIRAKVLGKTFISNIYYFRELDSTNDLAKKLKDEDNVLILTDSQTLGKGRFERKWESQKEKNLTFTIKKLFKLDDGKNNYVNFFFTYFLLEGVKEFLNKNFPDVNSEKLQIKWPNDILWDNKKLSGILIESLPNKNECIIGIGLNVNQKNFNPAYKACSLIEQTKAEINLSKILIHIVHCFSQNLYMLEEGNYDKIFDLWKKSTRTMGKSVEFTDAENITKKAKIVDFLENGGIKLLMKGEEKVYYSGDIKIQDSPGKRVK